MQQKLDMVIFGQFFEMNFVFFLILKSFYGKFLWHCVRKCSLRSFETINILSSQKYFELFINLLFLYNDFWIYMF